MVVKDLVLSLQWLGFNPWYRNFHMPQVQHFWLPCSIWSFPGQGLDPSSSRKLSCSNSRFTDPIMQQWAHSKICLLFFFFFFKGQDTIKLLEENISKAFSDINCTNVFLDQSPKTIEIPAKINWWDLVKLTSFAQQKMP